jgi:hypothetical protein
MKNTRICDARCMGATGNDCNCSCLGANHGQWTSEGFPALIDLPHGAKIRDHSAPIRSRLKPTTDEDNEPRLF